MIRYPRLYQKLYHEPLLIEAGARTALEQMLQAAMVGGIQAMMLEAASGEMKRRDPVTNAEPDLVAIVPIVGVIDRRIDAMEKLCVGGCDLMDVEYMLRSAADNPRVHTIVLDVDSPGGSALGVSECAALIREIGDGVDTISFINGQGCSAAMWLASQAHESYATPSAMVGSIGVYLALLDQTRMMEMAGVSVELIKAGKFKAMGASFKKITSEEREIFQARVDEIYEAFTADVKKARPKVKESTMQGQWFSGTEAVGLGLIDGTFNSMDELLSELLT